MHEGGHPNGNRISSTIPHVFMLIILISTIITAYTIWQATIYSGNAAGCGLEANGLRTLSNRYVGLGTAQQLVDVNVFLEWVSAKAENNTALAHFMEERFREEFKPAFYAWLNSSEGTGKIPPDTPFTLPEYKNSYFEKSNQLESEIEDLMNEADMSVRYASRLVLVTVLMAITIFLASIGREKKESMRLRLVILAVAFGILIIGLAVSLSLPPMWSF